MNANTSYDEDTQRLLADFDRQLADMQARHTQAVNYIATRARQGMGDMNQTTTADAVKHQRLIATVVAFAEIARTLRTTPIAHLPITILRAAANPVANRFATSADYEKPSEPIVIEGAFRIVTDASGASDTKTVHTQTGAGGQTAQSNHTNGDEPYVIEKEEV